MQWHRLDPDKTKMMISSIEAGVGSSLFTPQSSEAKCMRLPFYEGALLYRITNNTCLPIFSMDFLGNGTDFFYLDGSQTPFKQADEKAPLNLNEQNIEAYLQFYFFHVVQEDGEIYPIFNTSPLPDLEDQNIHATKQEPPGGVQAITIERDQVTNEYIVSTVLFYDGTFMTGKLAVDTKGDVTIQSLSPLLGQAEIGMPSTVEDSF